MLIFSSIFCLVSLSYLQKSKFPLKSSIQLFLVFYHSIPRISSGLKNGVMEVILHIILQEICREINN
jgi:hypothetical protein